MPSSCTRASSRSPSAHPVRLASLEGMVRSDSPVFSSARCTAMPTMIVFAHRRSYLRDVRKRIDAEDADLGKVVENSEFSAWWAPNRRRLVQTSADPNQPGNSFNHLIDKHQRHAGRRKKLKVHQARVQSILGELIAVRSSFGRIAKVLKVLGGSMPAVVLPQEPRAPEGGQVSEFLSSYLAEREEEAGEGAVGGGGGGAGAAEDGNGEETTDEEVAGALLLLTLCEEEGVGEGSDSELSGASDEEDGQAEDGSGDDEEE